MNYDYSDIAQIYYFKWIKGGKAFINDIPFGV